MEAEVGGFHLWPLDMLRLVLCKKFHTLGDVDTMSWFFLGNTRHCDALRRWLLVIWGGRPSRHLRQRVTRNEKMFVRTDPIAKRFKYCKSYFNLSHQAVYNLLGEQCVVPNVGNDYFADFNKTDYYCSC